MTALRLSVIVPAGDSPATLPRCVRAIEAAVRPDDEVNPIQILREHLAITDHDLPVDVIATPAPPSRSSECTTARAASWNHLQPPQIHEIPILERMGYA